MTKNSNTAPGNSQLITTAEQLEAWQKRLGWTGRRAAEELDITEWYFSKLVNGKARAGISRRIALSCAQLEQIYGTSSEQATSESRPVSAAAR